MEPLFSIMSHRNHGNHRNCLMSHTDLTDLTDFHLTQIFFDDKFSLLEVLMKVNFQYTSKALMITEKAEK